jgi:hypothetical protein
MKIFETSRRGFEVLLALLTIVGALSAFDFFLSGSHWNDPVLLLLCGSAAAVVFCLERIFGRSVLLRLCATAAGTITSSLFGFLAVATPLVGWLVAVLYSQRRVRWYESGEGRLVHFFEYAGILELGCAALLASIALFRRERAAGSSRSVSSWTGQSRCALITYSFGENRTV